MLLVRGFVGLLVILIDSSAMLSVWAYDFSVVSHSFFVFGLNSFIFVNFWFSLCVSLFSNAFPRLYLGEAFKLMQLVSASISNFKNKRTVSRNKALILRLLFHRLSAIEVRGPTRRFDGDRGPGEHYFVLRTDPSELRIPLTASTPGGWNLISSNNKRDRVKENSPGSILFHHPIYFAPQILSV